MSDTRFASGRTISFLTSAIMITGIGLIAPAAAQTQDSTGSVEQVALVSDAPDRLELVSHLRALSQEVAAASCALAMGIEAEKSRDMLTTAAQDFDRYIGALRDGNPDLGTMVAETDRQILSSIEEVEAVWQTVSVSVSAVLADPSDVESAHTVDDHNGFLLGLTNQLASDVRGRYTNPFLVSARDSMMLELAGRQLMLTQKMAKDICEIWSGHNAETGRAELIETMEVYKNSLQALRHGMPAAGIPEAPTEEIAAGLDGLHMRWAGIELGLQAELDREASTGERREGLFIKLQQEMAVLETLLTQYREYAERLL